MVPPKILECTLRDGAYAVGFQFSFENTLQIAKRLDDLGFPLIEVGHGLGLGASSRGFGTAAATDSEYMLAASKAVTRGKWGMFCIPSIAQFSDIELAADHGIGFVRIGTEVEDAETGTPFIERAVSAGIEVFCNLMKTYVAPPNKFAEQVKRCFDSGAQCVYIVDSAGGMLPHEIERYIEAARKSVPEVNLGFHGHNNLGLAVANSLFCAERGISIVDTSLQGLGRSAGNAPSSQLISVLMRAGFDLEYDVVDVMQAGEELARPYKHDVGYDTLDMTAGLGLFHSGYMERVLVASKNAQVDPRRVILALCRRDRISAPQHLIDEAVMEVAEQTLAKQLAPINHPEDSI